MTSPDPGLLALNTATVRTQWTLPRIVDGCVRHGIRGIAPWRDQVAAAGLKESAQRIRDAGLVVTGLCRGGMFPAANSRGAPTGRIVPLSSARSSLAWVSAGSSAISSMNRLPPSASPNMPG
jgi:hypothetical protein